MHGVHDTPNPSWILKTTNNEPHVVHKQHNLSSEWKPPAAAVLRRRAKLLDAGSGCLCGSYLSDVLSCEQTPCGWGYGEPAPRHGSMQMGMRMMRAKAFFRDLPGC